jgi:hypothetical protein
MADAAVLSCCEPSFAAINSSRKHLTAMEFATTAPQKIAALMTPGCPPAPGVFLFKKFYFDLYLKVSRSHLQNGSEQPCG